MKITIVAGARPNFMKIAPITRAIEAARALGKSISYRLVYTGRKDDTSLDASLFSDLDMKAPDVYLGVESSNPTSLTAGIMVAFEQELTRCSRGRRPHCHHELRYRCQETRNQSCPPRSRYPFFRYENAERSEPHDYGWIVRLSVHSRNGCQP